MTHVEQLTPTSPAARTPRRIIHRTRGRGHGGITRLMSPSDLGQALKPFVFLDHFNLQSASFPGMALHPHSGIATVTYVFEGDVRFEDTTGEQGFMREGGVEWFKAGQGAWHGGGAGESPGARGFQLWLALPPEEELGEVHSRYVDADEVRAVGPARVILGEYGGQSSPIQAPFNLTYLAVRLTAGERWRFEPAPGQTAAWIGVSRGSLLAPERIGAGELALLEPSAAAVEVVAETAVEFVIGSAAPHPHDLVLGYYSVHTSPAALEAGERRILEVRRDLEASGRM